MTGRGGLEIALDKIAFRYAEMEMGFDLSFPAASVTVIMGPSGSGKSTLLNLVAGFETPAGGRILIGGEDVTGLPPFARPVSMVFQENNLFSHLDVAANVGLGRSPSLKLSDEDRTAVADALVRTGLSGKERRLPSELSGGERQRVALARVLVRDRPVLLLDEPFASLDASLRREMTGLVGELHSRTHMTILMVTHDAEDARRIGDRVLRIEDGHVAAFGRMEDMARGGAFPDRPTNEKGGEKYGSVARKSS
jgi:thiamine transport system ATP-binding protein